MVDTTRSTILTRRRGLSGKTSWTSHELREFAGMDAVCVLTECMSSGSEACPTPWGRPLANHSCYA